MQGSQKEDKIAIILLAAGSSTRMGQSKQLLTVAGQPLLLRSSLAALESGADPVVVVLGANEEAHRKVIQELPIRIVHNPEWERGMGTSLRMGLSHLLKTDPKTGAVIIMVCDQPRLTVTHLKGLMQKYLESDNGIVASGYSETRGVPALFDRTFFQDLLGVQDDQGARKVLSQYSEKITSIGFPGGETDLDTQEDYQAFIQNHSQ